MPRLNPVGTYYGISYADFGVGLPGIANQSLTGVMPHSNPKYGVGFDSGTSSLSIVYPGSKVKSFGLSSFWYGCNTALRQSDVEDAVACNINVTGYKAKSTKPAATQSFHFTPAEPIDLQNAPTFGMFSSDFQGLEYANFTFTPSTLVALIVDNIVGSTQS